MYRGDLTLTFEIVLTVFDDYLQQDPLYEVIRTSHGYTLMAWEPRKNQWYTAEIMETPEILLDALLCKYAEYLEEQLTGSERDLTAAEQDEIDARCSRFKAECHRS